MSHCRKILDDTKFVGLDATFGMKSISRVRLHRSIRLDQNEGAVSITGVAYMLLGVHTHNDALLSGIHELSEPKYYKS